MTAKTRLLKVDCRTLLHTFAGRRLKFSKPLCFAVGFQWPCWTLSERERQRGKRGSWMTGHRGNPGQKEDAARKEWKLEGLRRSCRRERNKKGRFVNNVRRITDKYKTTVFVWSLTKGICRRSGHFPSLLCVPASLAQFLMKSSSTMMPLILSGCMTG